MLQLAPERDALLTSFGKTTLSQRYLLPGESYQDMFARVATAFSDNLDHAQRLYDYMSQLWFMPATPILSNGGAGRGLPISCFLNGVEDNLAGIQNTWNENTWLASNGGGIGTYWGDVRSIGEPVGNSGQTSGIIPFIRVMDSLTLAISQGSLRRGSAAVYLDIFHPEIEEFLEIRKPSGDFNRKALNLHHGVNIDDAFMIAVRDDTMYDLRSPKTGEVRKQVHARTIWQKILDLRLATGEPYIVWTDTANKHMPAFQRDVGLRVRQSNLCTEIMLHAGIDHLGNDRTAVCCLSSVNAETYWQWRDHPTFIEDVMRFLDNVLQDFIDRAPDTMAKARYSAMRERSVGLGLMGFHSFLQSEGVAFEGPLAKVWNMRLFKHLRRQADEASKKLAVERGACPDAADQGVMERFAHKLAVAPTASISIIAGGTSAGIEPIPANLYVHKTLSGSEVIRNRYLDKLLNEIDPTMVDRWWDSILEHEGSVQHLDCLNEDQKKVFRTAFEMDQRWIVELAADRTEDVCQASSVNVFLPADVDKWDLHMLHWKMWEKGCKSAYYLRSKSIQRAAHAGSTTTPVANDDQLIISSTTDYDECIACQ
ncbi:ribonucleotide reductase large subunit [Caulobacter phage Seuss]|uniref:Ribonucleoside-diphosphate reductase n=1 Tax=Caulobacter phage Seuss TaxID=1675601 RepID=A0A0K1LMZ5_9CAUD|nr:ribonucleoside-diphosphate reductase large subunit [Caulobacter phage Seuss]AKU43578.1 ribonucleotide reductase large subunit [Caulobacter phage Seuss]